MPRSAVGGTQRIVLFYPGNARGRIALAQTVTFIAHQGLTGAERCRSTRFMGQGHHTTFIVRDVP